MTSAPGGGKTDQTSFNRHLSGIACYNMLKTGAKREPVLQEPLPAVLDHRTFSRMKVELGRCDVCGTGKTVYRSREARANLCEKRCSRGAEFEHRRCEGAMRGWSGSGTGGRG